MKSSVESQITKIKSLPFLYFMLVMVQNVIFIKLRYIYWLFSWPSDFLKWNISSPDLFKQYQFYPDIYVIYSTLIFSDIGTGEKTTTIKLKSQRKNDARHEEYIVTSTCIERFSYIYINKITYLISDRGVFSLIKKCGSLWHRYGKCQVFY